VQYIMPGLHCCRIYCISGGWKHAATL
jgi:hypothetical protein